MESIEINNYDAASTFEKELEYAIQEFEDEAYHQSLHPNISDKSKAVALASMIQLLGLLRGESMEIAFKKYNGIDRLIK